MAIRCNLKHFLPSILRQSAQLGSLCLVLVLISGCASPKPFEKSSAPTDFSMATRQLAQSLIIQFDNYKKKNNGLLDTNNMTAFVIDPFIDGDTGDVTRASMEIERLINEIFVEPPSAAMVTPLNPTNLAKASYIIVGSVKYENYGSSQTKDYHLYASIVDIKTGIIIANSDSWISNKKIDSTPVSIYQNSPMYIKDSMMKLKVMVSQAAAASVAGGGYIDALNSLALSQEAGAEFERKNYASAINLFNQSIALPGGKNMKNYSGLYQSYYHLNQAEPAAKAFYDLFALAADSNNISVKFLFSVNSVNFIADQDIADQYNIWLRQAARYFADNSKCLTVIGHSSHTGEEGYNTKLSLARAQRIEKLLATNSPTITKRIQSTGRGFSENIIGTGTDDAQDMIDRRVEFQARSCS